MKQNLPTWYMQHVSARKMCKVFVLLLMFCGAVYAQPKIISEIPTGSKNFINVNGSLYFSAGDNLYKASSTTAPVLVKTTGQTILKIYPFSIGPSLFFVTQGATGQTLWRTDGTSANTVQVATYPQIIPLLSYQSGLYLSISTPETGTELWKMDGAYNVSILKDINPGSANGYAGSLIMHDGLLYFFGNPGGTTDLWRSDGTPTGTVVSADLDDTEFYYGSGFYGLTSVNDIMFFTWNYEGEEWGDRYAELWKTDGSTTGTSRVVRYTGGYSYNYMSDLLAFEGKLYFFHNIGDPIYTWFSVSDGTSEGTRHIDRTSIDGGPRQLIAGDNHVLFYAESQGYTSPIEKYDGTTVSVVHQFSMYHGTTDENIQLTYADGRAFFLDDVEDYYSGGNELWEADLSSGAKTSLAEKYGVSFGGSRNIVPDGGSIFFTRTLSGRLTLWYYDPDEPPTAACEYAGFIEREKWNDITGTSVSAVPVNRQPNSVSVLSHFESLRNEGNNYAARVRGYICAPETGNYVFYISSDDNSELWLSTDADPEHKRLIASSKYTLYNQWNKYPTQQSVEIPLIQGNKYYIEALHKEATGSDHLSVGWKLPGGTLERPISGTRLTPFERNIPPTIVITEPQEGATYQAPATVRFRAFARDTEGPVVKTTYYVNGIHFYETTENPSVFEWDSAPQGTYRVEARATDSGGYVGSDFKTFTISPGCAATGRIYQEIWTNTAGTDVRTFDYSTSPTGGARAFDLFETSQYYANNYASRMRGYVCVPQTGAYTFWISSDDSSELYLSTDDTEANKQLIAWVYGYTQFRNYDKYPSQKSAQITLQAGQRYYIEARHKEGTGNDFISVGWQRPDGVLERPMAGHRLIAISPEQFNPPSITITSPTPHETFTAPASIRLAANVTDPDGVETVTFTIESGGSGNTVATFASAPYEYQWNNVPSGSYRLLVYAEDNRGSGTSKWVEFTVESSSCEGTGTLVREIWTGIPGTSVSSIPTNSTPNRTVTLTSFSTPNYYSNDYGSRIRGYVCAPATGAYTFWISGDDNSELWLSDSDDPADKQRIAYVPGNSAINQWNKYSTQVSGTINLVQGQRYYIEVLHKEANGADHVEVGWRLPSGVLERPIPGNRVIPFEEASTSAAAFITEEISFAEESMSISVYPNPVVSGKNIAINLPDGVSGDVQVDVISTTGVALQTEQHVANGEVLTMDLKPSVIPGMYLIKVLNGKKRWVNKIQVK